MCSISGCIIFKKKRDKKELDLIDEKIKDIIIKGEDRGRDSFGVIVFRGDFNEKVIKSLQKPSVYFKEKKESLIDEKSIIVLNTDRAEPTTEYVKEKTFDDIQPFQFENIAVAHNGCIANDKELEKKYGLKRKTKIDTAIIPSLIYFNGGIGNIFELRKILRDELVGSYALAIYQNPHRYLYLATNYKPLFLLYDKRLDVLFFSSLENYLQKSDITNVFNVNEKLMQVPPYILLEIDFMKKKIMEISLRKEKKKKKALIIASSGLDSTVCIGWALKQGFEVELLHFQYRCRAEKREERAIKEIADFYNLPLHFVSTDIFQNVIKHSRLTNPNENGDLVKTNKGEASAELAWEWVPARNLIFMSIAAGFAEGHKFDYIILGGNLEESGAYPDNELIFQKKFAEILPYALNLNNEVEVLVPIASLMKHEIIKLGLDLKVPLHLTWSCYEDRETPCQLCGPDYMRRVGFKMNKKIDPQADDKESSFWEGCTL